MTAPYGYRAGELKVLCDGQSFAFAPTTNGGNDAYPHVLRALLPDLYRVEVVALGATTYAQRSPSAPLRVDARIPIADRTVLVDIAGQSDIIATAGNLTAAATLSAMETYWTARRAAGVDYVIAATLPPMSAAWLDADGETQRTTLNGLLAGSAGPDAIADLAGLGLDANDPADLYDGLHPTAATAVLFAGLVQGALAAIGLPT